MSDPDPKRLEALSEKLAQKQRKAKTETRKGAAGRKYQNAELVWRMVIELVVGMLIGVGIGYGLDSLFGTLPIFLMLFSILGFAAGVRTMMRTASEVGKKRGDAPQDSGA